jgi:ribose transport system ATP-binding protein
MVGERAVAETDSGELVQMIVGRKTREVAKPDLVPGETVLRLNDVHAGRAGPVSMVVRRSEIVGLVGLRGAGHEDISRALFGVEPHTGRIELDGAVPDLSSPVEALRSGIGLVARDRSDESIAMSLSVCENTYINPAAFGRTILNLLSPRREAEQAVQLGEDVRLSPNDPTLAIEALSGGNQQKVVMARWLATRRRLLLCEDPTAGVDVGAKAEIYALLNRALRDGVGILVVSTDFEEVANICHRAIVFGHGRVVGELSGDALTAENLIQAASAGRLMAAE